MSDDVGTAGHGSQAGRGSGGTRDIETHFNVIAVIELIFAVPFLFMGALFFFGGFVGGGFAEAFGDVPGIGGVIAGAGILLGLFMIVLALPGLVSAYGLFKRRSWAKVWTIVVGALNLINFPIGTIFGIYAIWAMTRPETDAALGQPRPA